MYIAMYGDKLYPKMLETIPNKPKRLYIKGNIELLNKTGIAVVGSRSHSRYGKKMCEKFVQELVKVGIVIISGLANGIDSIAHKECLKNNGKTIAVIPCGFKNIFPPENIELLDNILKNDGCVITEYEENVVADSNLFLERNRIVAGLAICTLVIEAGYRSGTSVTARITQEQGKKVFAVPSSLENRKGITSNELIQKGAKLVTSAKDILEEFEYIDFSNIIKLNKEKIINSEYLNVYKLLSDEPIHINQIAKKANISIEDASYQLMMLEISGDVVQLPGKEFIKS